MQNSSFLRQNNKLQINGGPYARNSILSTVRLFFSRRKFGKSCPNFSQMVTSFSFSLELKKEVLLVRKNFQGVPSQRWRLSKDRAEKTGEKYTGLKTHTAERTPAWRNQRSRLFPEEPIGARPGGLLPSAPSGQEVGGPPEKRRRWNSQHAVPKRHTLELPQEMFGLFL